MTATITPPEWLTVGAKVAVVNGASVTFATVERFTATTVVVGGHRYRLGTLSRNLGTWEGTARLERPDAPEVAVLLFAQNRDRAVRRAEHALQVWRRNGRWDVGRAAAVRDALADLAPYLPTDTEEPRP